MNADAIRTLPTDALGKLAALLALYARGLTVPEMEALLREMYGVGSVADLTSNVTDAVVANTDRP